MGGLAAEAAGGDSKTGALAAGVNEALVGSLSQWYGTMDPEQKKRLLTMNSQVIGVLAAAAQGGDEAALQTGAWVAGTATQYNYLLHEERVEMLKRQDECLDQQCKEDIREEYAELDEGRNKRLPETCRQSPELCETLLSKLIADRPLLQEEVNALKREGKVEITAVILFVVGQSNEAAMQEIVSALSQESEFKQGLGQVLLGVATGGGGRTPKPSVGQGGGKTGPTGGAGDGGVVVGAKAPGKDYVDILSPEAKQHILYGDKPGSGGHMWPGQQGKTVFPESWSGEKIVHAVGDITTSPNTKWYAQTGIGGLIRLKGTLPSGLLMKLVMECVCELYTSQLQGKWLPHFLMMLRFHLISRLGKFYVCRPYY